MRVIAFSTLEQFWIRHADAEEALRAWHDEAKSAKWKSPQDIKRRFSTASFVGSNRVVFNVKGNSYRLVTSVSYPYGAVYIKFVGTHADYSRIDAAMVEHR